MNPVLLFDGLIALALGGSFFGGWYFLHQPHCVFKKKYPCWIIGILCLIPGTVIFYGSFIEPQRLVVRTFDYSFPDKPLAHEKTIVLLSDTHVGPYKKGSFSERVVKKIIDVQPDAVLFAGDYFFEHAPAIAKQHLEPYAALPKLFPTIAVMGNHDFDMGLPGYKQPDYELAQSVRDTLRELGFLEIEDVVTELFEPDNLVHIIGSQDLWSGVNDYESIKLPPRSERTILLTHNPNIIFDAKNDVDLVLGGHTHGGQIRLPFIGPLAKPGPTPIPREYFQGPSYWNDTTLYITSGVGESGTRARLFNPPEIVVITLH